MPLIVGELCLDVCAQISVRGEALAVLPHNANMVTTARSPLRWGTAWPFANALASMTGLIPLIAAVGTDQVGQLLAAAIAEQDFLAIGLLRAAGTHTDILSIINFPGTGKTPRGPGGEGYASDFANKIGHMLSVEMGVGELDVLLGEFRTLVRLAFGQAERLEVGIRPAMLGCARSVVHGRAGAVVQHQSSTTPTRWRP